MSAQLNQPRQVMKTASRLPHRIAASTNLAMTPSMSIRSKCHSHRLADMQQTTMGLPPPPLGLWVYPLTGFSRPTVTRLVSAQRRGLVTASNQILLWSKAKESFGSVCMCNGHLVNSSNQNTKICLHGHPYSQSASKETKEDSRKDFRRKRLFAFIGTFAVLHLCVLWARYYHRKQKEATGPENYNFDKDVPSLYLDPDLGGTPKMISYKGFLLPIFVQEFLPEIKNFNVRDSDIFVSSFPKSGTTWVQEMVFLIETGVDVKAAAKANIEQRFPYLEFIYPGVAEVAKQTSPRMIKTHLPWAMMPEQVKAGKAKVIYITRNPKDVSVSYFHYIRMMSEISYKGNFSEFFEKFISGKVAYGPWWSHVQEYWECRDNTNVLFLTYEQLHEDMAGCIVKVASFLGRTLTPSQVSEIAAHCSFSQMSANPAVNYTWWDDVGLRHKTETKFMRKGVVGDWQNYYTPGMVAEVDSMCRHTIETQGLRLQDKL